MQIKEAIRKRVAEDMPFRQAAVKFYRTERAHLSQLKPHVCQCSYCTALHRYYHAKRYVQVLKRLECDEWKDDLYTQNYVQRLRANTIAIELSEPDKTYSEIIKSLRKAKNQEKLRLIESKIKR